jgi:sec-independent protein translocase protein TatA
MVGDILQPTHLLLILVVALLVLGPKRLPEVGRAVGRGLHDFRSAINGEPEPPPAPIPAARPTPEPIVTAQPAPEPIATAQPVPEPIATAQPAPVQVTDAQVAPDREPADHVA